MFTGIIEAVGEVVSFKGSAQGGRLTLRSKPAFKKIQVGESIAVNGCCLTVISKKSNPLVFDVSDETLRKTNLGDFKPGHFVNLERALTLSSRLGGHFVLGHVDGVGTIRSLKRTKGSLEMGVQIPKHLFRYLIDKGSIAIDGVSLTVSLQKEGFFSVYLIPHTEKSTNLHAKKVGDSVNIEVDMLGKYVDRLIGKKG